MALVKWVPFRELTDIHNTADRLFGDRYLRRFNGEGLFSGWAPSVDVYEKDNEMIIEAEIPGMSEKDISVEVKDNVLTLTGERKKEHEVKEENYHRTERFYGKFQRSFTLPDTIDTEKVAAKVKGGVLTVRLPKAPKAIAKKVSVAVE